MTWETAGEYTEDPNGLLTVSKLSELGVGLRTTRMLCLWALLYANSSSKATSCVGYQNLWPHWDTSLLLLEI